VVPFEAGPDRLLDDYRHEILSIFFASDPNPDEVEQVPVAPEDQNAGRAPHLQVLAGVAGCDKIGNEIVVTEFREFMFIFRPELQAFPRHVRARGADLTPPCLPSPDQDSANVS